MPPPPPPPRISNLHQSRKNSVKSETPFCIFGEETVGPGELSSSRQVEVESNSIHSARGGRGGRTSTFADFGNTLDRDRRHSLFFHPSQSVSESSS